METTSLASGRLLRAGDVDDLSKFDEQTGFISFNFDQRSILHNQIMQLQDDGGKNYEADDDLPAPVTEDGRPLRWPRTVLKRTNVKATSFRNSEPIGATLNHPQMYQKNDRYSYQ